MFILQTKMILELSQEEINLIKQAIHNEMQGNETYVERWKGRRECQLQKAENEKYTLLLTKIINREQCYWNHTDK